MKRCVSSLNAVLGVLLFPLFVPVEGRAAQLSQKSNTLLLDGACEYAMRQDQKDGLEAKVDSLIQPLIKSSKVAGVTIGVMQNDTILLLKSYGHADLEFRVPMPLDASYEIGSMTKQFTAVAILQLVEKGALKLDDTIDQHITFDAVDQKITVRQLLNHTSGVKTPDLKDLIYHKGPRETVLRMAEKEKVDFAPGTAMLYSNTGYFILGLIIEKVTGLPYEKYVAENILLKAGMDHTYFADAETVREHRAHGYNNVRDDGKLSRAEQPYFHWTFSAGALCSTAGDLLRWHQVLHTSQKILNQKSYQELIAAGHLNSGIPLRYAKGLEIGEYKGNKVIGHGGSGSGFVADARYFPDLKLTVVTLQNTYRPAYGSEMSYSVAEQLLPISQKKAEPKYPGDLSIFKGTYKGFGTEATVDVVDAKLVVKRPWQQKGDTLIYQGGQKWSLGNDQLTFVTADGKVKEMHWDFVMAYITLKKQ